MLEFAAHLADRMAPAAAVRTAVAKMALGLVADLSEMGKESCISGNCGIEGPDGVNGPGVPGCVPKGTCGSKDMCFTPCVLG